MLGTLIQVLCKSIEWSNPLPLAIYLPEEGEGGDGRVRTVLEEGPHEPPSKWSALETADSGLGTPTGFQGCVNEQIKTVDTFTGLRLETVLNLAYSLRMQALR